MSYTHILIWVVTNSAIATGSAEFHSLERCQEAAAKMRSDWHGLMVNVRVMCVPKGTSR